MSIRYDEKGKFFTEIVTKDHVPVIVQTPTHRIEGQFYVRVDYRLKDELNGEEQFIAITEAKVFDQAGNLVYQSKFLAINRQRVIWVIPKNDLQEKSASAGGGV
jgi:hypothetical protein